MLTAIAILERELGSIDYARHLLAARDPAQRAARRDLAMRRRKTLRLLDELHAQRRQPDAGRSARARPGRR